MVAPGCWPPNTVTHLVDWALERLVILAHHGDFWVAAATIALAVATFAMVRQTRHLAQLTRDELAAIQDQAHTAQEDVAVAREALEASYRPILVDVSATGDGDEHVAYLGASFDVPHGSVHAAEKSGYLYCSVPLRNAGPGVAFMEAPGLRWSDEATPIIGDSSLHAVPPGDEVRLRFSIRDRIVPFAEVRAAVIEAGTIVVEAGYADIVGTAQPTTRAEFARNDEGAWEARRVTRVV